MSFVELLSNFYPLNLPECCLAPVLYTQGATEMDKQGLFSAVIAKPQTFDNDGQSRLLHIQGDYHEKDCCVEICMSFLCT